MEQISPGVTCTRSFSEPVPKLDTKTKPVCYSVGLTTSPAHKQPCFVCAFLILLWSVKCLVYTPVPSCPVVGLGGQCLAPWLHEDMKSAITAGSEEKNKKKWFFS